MRVPDPSTVTSELELRRYAVRLLAKWIADLDRTGFAFIFPGARGSCGSFPTCPFHLRPELFLQISGRTTFQFPHEVCQVGPGEICLVSRGLPHRERARPWRGPFFNVVIGYDPDGIQLHLARQDNNGRPCAAIVTELPTVEGGHLADLLRNAADWFNSGDSVLRRAVRASLLANLSIILAAIKGEVTETREPVKVMQMRRLIHPHLSHPQLSVDWIGRSLQNNAEYLSHLFREARGRTLVSYIIERRMIRAKELLASSTLNISEISRACGYADSSYFSRLFRKEPVSPRANTASTRCGR